MTIVGDNENLDYYRFHKVHPSGNQLIYDAVNFITAHTAEYEDGNDSYYDVTSKMLYTTRFTRVGVGSVTTNAIFQYDLTAGVSGTDGFYAPVRFMELLSNLDETKFEIEGMAVHDSSRKKYVCANINQQQGVEGIDTLCFIHQ